jgi:hypothetical protein
MKMRGIGRGGSSITPDTQRERERGYRVIQKQNGKNKIIDREVDGYGIGGQTRRSTYAPAEAAEELDEGDRTVPLKVGRSALARVQDADRVHLPPAHRHERRETHTNQNYSRCSFVCVCAFVLYGMESVLFHGIKVGKGLLEGAVEGQARTDRERSQDAWQLSQLHRRRGNERNMYSDKERDKCAYQSGRSTGGRPSCPRRH